MTAKVLFVIGGLTVGGAERHLVQITPVLAKNFDVAVYVVSAPGKMADVLESNGVKLYKPYFLDTLDKLPVYIRKPLIMVLSSVSYLRVLSKYNPDILHFFLPQAYLFGAILSFLSRKRIRLMSRRSLNFYQKKHKGLTRIEHALHLKMDAVLGNSISVNEQLIEEGVPQDKLGLIYNGVNLNQFKNLPPRSKVRGEIGVGHDDLMMVCVANLIQYKGHADLLQALHTIKHDLPNGWRLILVGRFTEYAAVLQAMVSEVGLTENVIFLGERTDAIAICSAADIGLLCSHEEGFSNSILEGMLAGLPMIVTNVGGNAEAVINEVCGLVVASKQPHLLAEAILKLANDPVLRGEMASKGRERARQEFSFDTCVKKYSSLYQGLLRKSKLSISDVINLAK